MSTNHLCEGIVEDEMGFYVGTCTCRGYETVPVPDLDLAVDELMAHAARMALVEIGTTTKEGQ